VKQTGKAEAAPVDGGSSLALQLNILLSEMWNLQNTSLPSEDEIMFVSSMGDAFSS
jgi:hypothetical protein